MQGLNSACDGCSWGPGNNLPGMTANYLAAMDAMYKVSSGWPQQHQLSQLTRNYSACLAVCTGTPALLPGMLFQACSSRSSLLLQIDQLNIPFCHR